MRELAQYLARCARTLHHSPAPCEVDGGAFIEQRFGSWDAALRAACSAAYADEGEAERHGPLPQGTGHTGAAVPGGAQGKEAAEADRENLRQGQLAHEKAVKRRAEKEAAEAAEQEVSC
ncbi:MAG: homing endonuclease associated repeat-containing protein [Dysosmobacter sp.]